MSHDFSIDDFVTNNFWATEACGNFIVTAYNFMSLLRHALINSNKKKFLKTIRYELISTPAYLGRTKDKHILYLARSLKTRQSLAHPTNPVEGCADANPKTMLPNDT